MALIFDGVTQAELDACTDQLSWGRTLIAALGDNRRVEYRHTTSGDVWTNGTTFYAATLTGPMTVLAGKVQNFGSTSDVTVKLPVNLSTGTAAVRATSTNGSRWMQAPLVLKVSGQPIPEGSYALRRSPSGEYGIGHTAAKTTAPLELAPAPDLQLATLSLVNLSGATVATNFISPFFGQGFKQGEVPAGSFPQFKTLGGVTCPATMWGVTTWPDGSMKWCAVIMRVPQSLAGNASMTISVRSGGTAPAASARTTAELVSADIKVEMTVVDPAEGTYVSSLNDGITVGDDIVQIASGPAGAIWRVGAFWRNGGGEHGQLYCWHYVAALTSSTGALMGLRYMGRVSQPWADTTSPAPRYRDVTGTVKRGTTTIRALTGHLDTETPGATIRLNAWSSFMTAGTDGKWDFIQGGGSATSDSLATVQVVPHIDYATDTGQIPPFVRASAQVNALVDYYPMGAGQMLRYMPNTGGRNDLGVLTKWDVNYLCSQTPQNERSIRVHALMCGGWRIAMRRKSTRRIIPVSAVRESYAGLGTIQSTWRVYGSSNAGYTTPTPNASLWVEDTAHRPNMLFLSYFITGEPQFLDLIHDNAAAQQGGLAPGLLTVNNVLPIHGTLVLPWVGERDNRVGVDGPTRVGAGFAFIAGRTGAWPTRDMGVAALMTPDVMPGGTGETDYFRDIITNIHQALYDYTVRMPASHVADGIWALYNGGPESPWQLSFWNHTMCWQSAAFDTPNSIVARKYMLRRYTRALELFDPGNLIAYRMQHFNENGDFVSMADMVWSTHRQVATNASTGRMTVLPPRNGSNDLAGFTLTEGDIFAFTNDLEHQYPNPFPQYGWNKRLYAVNVVGQTCELSATRNGPPLAMTVTQTMETLYMQLHNLDAATSLSPDSEYTIQIAGALRYHERLGDAGATAARAIFDPKATAKGVLATDVSQFNFRGA